jgi:hypothetical protein
VRPHYHETAICADWRGMVFKLGISTYPDWKCHISERDLRIDFFRGLALYMVVVDHIGDDPLSRFTYGRLGFSDAAEIFVYVSGVVCGLAYSSLLERRGWGALMQTLGARTIRVYFYYALSSAAMILLIAAAADIWKNEFRIDDYVPGVMRYTDPVMSIWSALLLISPPGLSDILVFYIAMTLVAVPILLAGFRYSATATLAVSALVWGGSQSFSGSLLSLEGYWAINPFAWQFLFSIGMFFGTKRKSTLSDLQSSVVALAWAIVVAAFLYKVILHVAPALGFDVAWLTISPSTLAKMKMNLSILRLTHFLSVALLVARYLGPRSTLLQSPMLALVIQTGARPLEIYSLTVVLSMLAHIVVAVYHPSLPSKVVMDGVIFSLVALTATILLRLKMPGAPALK